LGQVNKEENKMTIKQIKEDPKLANLMTEDLDELQEDTEVVFEAWAIGYDKEGNIIDYSICLANGPEPQEVVETAQRLTLDNVPTTVEGDQVMIEVESTVAISEDEFVNIGTIYSKPLEN
jgi:DNA-directed RNA polymerase subunit L